ncbi:MAG: hypothetical protein FJ304_23460 [Planctomycetes bacterium]|nr:hypothetical protein [Planctomycetota bacterium]
MTPRPPTPSDPHTPPMAEAVPEAAAAETASGSHTAASGDRPPAPPAPAPAPAANDEVGPYRIRAPLGRGGMAVVYLADEVKLKRQVALKILLPSMAAADPLAKERFQREAEAQAAVEHDHIVSIQRSARGLKPR